MLQFLQTGKVLYVLAGICGLGAISKLVTSSLYKRLIKETGNMALTKNRNLRALKQKTENMFLISHGIRNTGAYIDKQVYGFRFMNLSLDSWDNLSVQAMILCFLVGGLAAFGAYWYRCDSYYIVLYGTMGILSGLFLVLVDNSVNVSMKRQQLTDCLVDYVENSPHFYRPMESVDLEKKVTPRARLREIGKKDVKAVEESAASEESVQEREEEKKTENGSDRKGNGKLSVLSRRKGRREPMVQSASTVGSIRGAGSPGDSGKARGTGGAASEDDELTKSIDYLKQSFEQIAASREHTRRELQAMKVPENSSLDRAKKELKPEDIKLLGEILQEYLT